MFIRASDRIIWRGGVAVEGRGGEERGWVGGGGLVYPQTSEYGPCVVMSLENLGEPIITEEV